MMALQPEPIEPDNDVAAPVFLACNDGQTPACAEIHRLLQISQLQ